METFYNINFKKFGKVKKNIKILILIFCVLNISNEILSQENTQNSNQKSDATSNLGGNIITIDPSKSEEPNSIPFDTHLKFKYVSPNNIPVNFIGMFKLNKNGCVQRIENLKCEIKDIKKLYKLQINKLLNRTNRRVDFCLNNPLKIDTIELITKNLDNNKFASTSDSIKYLRKKLKCEIKDYKSSPEATSLFYKLDNTSSKEIIISIPPLRPSNNYLLVAVSYSKPKLIDTVINALFNNDTINAKQIYQNIRRDESVVHDCRSCNKDSFSIAPFDYFNTVYETVLKQKVIDLHKQKELYSYNNNLPMLNLIDFNDKILDENLFSRVIKLLNSCSVCIDSITAWNKSIENRNDFIQIYSSFSILNDSSISYGYVDLLTDFSGTSKTISLEERVNNISKSMSQIKSMIESINYYYDLFINKKNESNNKYYEILDYFNDIYNKLSTNVIKINQVIYKNNIINNNRIKLLNEIDSCLKYRGIFLSQANFNSVNTYTYNFDTRSKFIMLPDFGFMYYSNIGNSKILNGISPYLGFHVNLRPINTDIPSNKLFNRKFWESLSFNSGALIGSFKKDSTRTGLFGEIAIFTGVGYALTDWLRVIGGNLWYKANDENPLNNDLKIVTLPYLSLSIDFRLKTISDTFKNIFLFK